MKETLYCTALDIFHILLNNIVHSIRDRKNLQSFGGYQFQLMAPDFVCFLNFKMHLGYIL